MLDQNKREWMHFCPDGHMFKVFADFIDKTNTFTYASPLDALCPMRKPNGETCGKLAVVRLRPGMLGPVFNFGHCYGCRSRMCIEMQFDSTGMSSRDALEGYAYYKLPQPYPLYCETCAMKHGNLNRSRSAT